MHNLMSYFGPTCQFATDAWQPTCAVGVADPERFPIRRIVRLGAGPRSGHKFCRRIERKRGKTYMDDWARAMLCHPDFPFFPFRMDLEIALVVVSQLGFPEGRPVRYHEICANAFERRLYACPAETGPQCRKQLVTQGQGQSLTIFSNPVPSFNQDPSLFVVRNVEGGPCLASRGVHAQSFFLTTDLLAFAVAARSL